MSMHCWLVIVFWISIVCCLLHLLFRVIDDRNNKREQPYLSFYHDHFFFINYNTVIAACLTESKRPE